MNTFDASSENKELHEFIDKLNSYRNLRNIWLFLKVFSKGLMLVGILLFWFGHLSSFSLKLTSLGVWIGGGGTILLLLSILGKKPFFFFVDRAYGEKFVMDVALLTRMMQSPHIPDEKFCEKYGGGTESRQEIVRQGVARVRGYMAYLNLQKQGEVLL